MEIKKFNIGDIVKLKKKHPCGSDEWEVVRIGADFKIKCLGCGHIVMLTRHDFQKDVKKVLSTKEERDSNE